MVAKLVPTSYTIMHSLYTYTQIIWVFLKHSIFEIDFI